MFFLLLTIMNDRTCSYLLMDTYCFDVISVLTSRMEG